MPITRSKGPIKSTEIALALAALGWKSAVEHILLLVCFSFDTSYTVSNAC